MCSILYFYFCTHTACSPPKISVSTHHHTVDSLYPFHPHFLFDNHDSVLCIYVCFCLFWFLHIYFFSQLILLSIILSRPIHFVANSNISSFYGWVVFHCIYTRLKFYFKSFFVFHPNNLAGLKLCYMVLQFPNIHVLKNFLG